MTGSDDPAVSREPEPIKAVPLRRPGRWIAAGIILVLLGLFVYGAATNEAYQWGTYGRYLSSAPWPPLSPNPVLRSTAWVYLWIFRGTPVFVQLVFWGLFPSLYRQIDLGVPFGPQFFHLDVQGLQAAFAFAVIGLGLNEAAYMAEIVRAGINSVGEGQREASIALGMSWAQTMRRTVLPQAMRVIIPPTGNELIGMLKTTSLVTAIPLSTDLYGRARDIYGVNFQPIPLLLVTATWYLAITSVLMVGQYYLERHYSRGASRQLTAKQLRELADAQKLDAAK